jgi:transcriptional regulator with XRE-family HTH domain
MHHMRSLRVDEQPLDLTSGSHISNAMRLTQARRRLFNDLIGIRKRRGISQAQVARAIGINRSGISRFESDIECSNPTVDVILRYAHAVGATIHMKAEPVEVTEAHTARIEQFHVVWRGSAPATRLDAGFVEMQPASHSVTEVAGWTVAGTGIGDVRA